MSRLPSFPSESAQGRNQALLAHERLLGHRDLLFAYSLRRQRHWQPLPRTPESE